ncbi:MAG: hypothetical protein DSZ23_00060 [Thermodesulfatator sp.]|nr:MAG: hypothetical protein DSZ23_00060 [Thermodesulfatator sp.]
MTTKSATLRMPQRRIYSPARNNKTRRAASPITIPVKFSLKAVAAIFILSVFVGLSFITSYKIRSIAQEIQMLENRYLTVTQENKILSEKFSAVANPKKLAALGKKLGLRQPSTDQIITLR